MPPVRPPGAPFGLGTSKLLGKHPKVRFPPNFGHLDGVSSRYTWIWDFSLMVSPHFALQNHFITGGFGEPVPNQATQKNTRSEGENMK